MASDKDDLDDLRAQAADLTNSRVDKGIEKNTELAIIRELANEVLNKERARIAALAGYSEPLDEEQKARLAKGEHLSAEESDYKHIVYQIQRFENASSREEIMNFFADLKTYTYDDNPTHPVVKGLNFENPNELEASLQRAKLRQDVPNFFARRWIIIRDAIKNAFVGDTYNGADVNALADESSAQEVNPQTLSASGKNHAAAIGELDALSQELADDKKEKDAQVVSGDNVATESNLSSVQMFANNQVYDAIPPPKPQLPLNSEEVAFIDKHETLKSKYEIFKQREAQAEQWIGALKNESKSTDNMERFLVELRRDFREEINIIRQQANVAAAVNASAEPLGPPPMEMGAPPAPPSEDAKVAAVASISQSAVNSNVDISFAPPPPSMGPQAGREVASQVNAVAIEVSSRAFLADEEAFIKKYPPLRSRYADMSQDIAIEDLFERTEDEEHEGFKDDLAKERQKFRGEMYAFLVNNKDQVLRSVAEIEQGLVEARQNTSNEIQATLLQVDGHIKEAQKLLGNLNSGQNSFADDANKIIRNLYMLENHVDHIQRLQIESQLKSNLNVSTPVAVTPAASSVTAVAASTQAAPNPVIGFFRAAADFVVGLVTRAFATSEGSAGNVADVKQKEGLNSSSNVAVMLASKEFTNAEKQLFVAEKALKAEHDHIEKRHANRIREIKADKASSPQVIAAAIKLENELVAKDRLKFRQKLHAAGFEGVERHDPTTEKAKESVTVDPASAKLTQDQVDNIVSPHVDEATKFLAKVMLANVQEYGLSDDARRKRQAYITAENGYNDKYTMDNFIAKYGDLCHVLNRGETSYGIRSSVVSDAAKLARNELGIRHDDTVFTNSFIGRYGDDIQEKLNSGQRSDDVAALIVQLQAANPEHVQFYANPESKAVVSDKPFAQEPEVVRRLGEVIILRDLERQLATARGDGNAANIKEIQDRLNMFKMGLQMRGEKTDNFTMSAMVNKYQAEITAQSKDDLFERAVKYAEKYSFEKIVVVNENGKLVDRDKDTEGKGGRYVRNLNKAVYKADYDAQIKPEINRGPAH